MSIYSKDGEWVYRCYDLAGAEKEYAYDMSGDIVFPDGIPLKVMTYNVQRFQGVNAQQAMQNLIISKYTPDIIGMQELGADSLPQVGVNMLTDYSVKQLSNHNNKIMMVTKGIQLNNLVIADFEHQDPLDISTWGETRAYMKADITIGDRAITWINTHLCVLTKSVTYQQMKEIFDMAEECDRCIITGDFNSSYTSPTSDDYLNMYKQFVDAGYNLANNSPESYFQPTATESPSASSLSQLTDACDSIIVSGNIGIRSTVFDTTKFSYLNGSPVDHIPVVADLMIE